MNRTPEQMELTLDALRQIWLKYPTLRLGQLMICATDNDHVKGPCLFYLRDENLVDALKKFDKIYGIKAP